MLRIDKFLVEKGFFPSREKAQDAVLQGTVKVNGEIITKTSKPVDENTEIEIVNIFNRYVSRGGLKLEKAIIDFELDFENKRVLDIGASTGGFTDCALQHGATFCCAVDVGSHQLHQDLLQNSKVLSLENKDFRTLNLEEAGGERFDYIVGDVSFISLTHILPYFQSFLKENGALVLLIKPQFEAGASFLNKGGIVTNEKGYKAAIQRIEKEALNNDFHLKSLSISTLFEINKNVEFLTLFSKENQHFTIDYQKLFLQIKEIKKKLKK